AAAAMTATTTTTATLRRDARAAATGTMPMRRGTAVATRSTGRAAPSAITGAGH
ncbi:hypothetical protein GGI00_004872, partial [Coemansia sp. RSA 2681]